MEKHTFCCHMPGVSRYTLFVRKVMLLLVVFCASTTIIPRAFAQDEKMPGVMMGDYKFSGDLTLGYRSVSTGGLDGRSDFWAERRYDEAYNYRSGVRLTNINLFGERQPGAKGVFDELYLTANGIGDPFTNAMLRMRTIKGYDLKISYTKADYYLNRNDSLYTGLHKFDMRREMVSASLSVPLWDNLSVELRYSGNGRSGTMTTTFTPHIEGASATATSFSGVYGSYTRDNFYWMDTPRNDWTNTFSGNIKLTLPSSTTIIVGGGSRSFSQNITPTPESLTSLNYRPATPPNTLGIVGLNPRDERLTQYAWQEKRSTSTPFIFAEAVTKPASWLSLTATARMEFLSGDGTINGGWEGLVRKAATPTSATAPLRAYRTAENGIIKQKLDKTLASLLATVHLTDQLQLTFSYRYESEKQDLSGDYAIAIDTSASTNPVYRKASRDSIQNMETDYRVGIVSHTISPQLVYVPIANLNLRAGLQYYVRTPEIRRLEEGTSDSAFAANLSKKTTTMSPFFSAYYRPISGIRLRGHLQTYTNNAYWEGTSTVSSQFTRLIPDSRTNYSVSADVEPMEDLTFSLRWDNDNAKSTLTMLPTVRGDLQMKSQSLGLTASLSYTLNEKTRIIVTGQYRERNFSIPATFARGSVIYPTPPFSDSLTVLISNNTIDRYVDASFVTTAIRNLRIMAGISHVSSTGGGGMTTDIRPPAAQDITPIGGPYKMTDIHGQVRYQFISNLAVTVDYRYVLLNEQVGIPYTGFNNFVGNLLFLGLELRL